MRPPESRSVYGGRTRVAIDGGLGKHRLLIEEALQLTRELGGRALERIEPGGPFGGWERLACEELLFELGEERGIHGPRGYAKNPAGPRRRFFRGAAPASAHLARQPA